MKYDGNLIVLWLMFHTLHVLIVSFVLFCFYVRQSGYMHVCVSANNDFCIIICMYVSKRVRVRLIYVLSHHRVD